MQVYGKAILSLTRQPENVTFMLAEALDTATCFAETKPLDFGDPTKKKILGGLRCEFSGPNQVPNVVLQLSHKNRLEDEWVNLPNVPLNADSIAVFRPPKARYWKIRIADLGVMHRWHLSAIEVFGVFAGGRN